MSVTVSRSNLWLTVPSKLPLVWPVILYSASLIFQKPPDLFLFKVGLLVVLNGVGLIAYLVCT